MQTFVLPGLYAVRYEWKSLLCGSHRPRRNTIAPRTDGLADCNAVRSFEPLVCRYVSTIDEPKMFRRIVSLHKSCFKASILTHRYCYMYIIIIMYIIVLIVTQRILFAVGVAALFVKNNAKKMIHNMRIRSPSNRPARQTNTQFDHSFH